jgi:hypothetical protein
MKKNIMLVMLGITISLAAISQSVKVPTAVKSAFKAKFPTATNVKWGKENAKEFEANFKLNATTMSASFDAKGNWTETETQIAATALPDPVTTAIKNKYPGAVITKGDKIERPSKTLYEANVKVNNKKMEVILTPEGTFTKS